MIEKCGKKKKKAIKEKREIQKQLNKDIISVCYTEFLGIDKRKHCCCVWKKNKIK